MVTIGILNFENPEPFRTMLRDSLRDLGYTEGENLRLEFRSAEGNRDRLPDLAAELVGLKVDVLVAYPTPAVVASKQATREIPIVMLAAGDPLGTGLVASLARPGDNITGTSSTTAESGSKTLELVRDILPSVRRVAVLANANDPFTKSYGCRRRPTKSSTRPRCRSGPEISRPGNRAHWCVRGAGRPAAYSGSQAEMARRTAAIVDKILKGSKPADLPVEQPTTFELALNLKTAKALGITVPLSLLGRADQVIE